MADAGSEYDLIDFHNGSDFPLDMVWDRRSYGIVEPHATVKVIRFVAEHWARRNEKYQLVEDSPVSKEIEEEKRNTAAAEVLDRKRVENEVEQAEKDRELAAKVKKMESEKVLEKEPEEMEAPKSTLK